MAGTTNSWGYQLSKLIGCQFSNFAKGSWAYYNKNLELTGFGYHQQEVEAVKDWSTCTHVVVSAGIRDANRYVYYDSTGLANDIQAFITAIKAKTDAPILIVTPFRTGNSETAMQSGNLLMYDVLSLDNMITNICAKNGVSVMHGIDFPITMTNDALTPNAMSNDGVHPNELGAKTAATYAKSKLKMYGLI